MRIRKLRKCLESRHDCWGGHEVPDPSHVHDLLAPELRAGIEPEVVDGEWSFLGEFQHRSHHHWFALLSLNPESLSVFFQDRINRNIPTMVLLAPNKFVNNPCRTKEDVADALRGRKYTFLQIPLIPPRSDHILPFNHSPRPTGTPYLSWRCSPHTIHLRYSLRPQSRSIRSFR